MNQEKLISVCATVCLATTTILGAFAVRAQEVVPPPNPNVSNNTNGPTPNVRAQTGAPPTLPVIGLTWQDSSDGPLVSAVLPRGPADQAGLRAGDHIVSIDGKAGKATDLTKYVRSQPLGSQLTVIFRRAGAQMTAKVSSVNAYDLYQQLANQGNPEAQVSLARGYATGEWGPKDDDKALGWYQKAADEGNPEAESAMGYMYESGFGVGKDLKKSAAWYEKAANSGYVWAESQLGSLYLYENGSSKDLKKALYWTQKAADLGEPNAEANLGYMLSAGLGTPRDDQKSFFWNQKAAEAGNNGAQSNLGKMYEYGTGVPIDLEKASYWCQKAAQQGNQNAKQELAKLTRQGSIFEMQTGAMQEAPPPSRPAAEGVSLADTMTFIQQKLSGSGQVNFVATVSDGTDADPANVNIAESWANVAADTGTCRITYHNDLSSNGARVIGADTSIALWEVEKIEVMPMEQFFTAAAAKAGHPEWSAQVQPPVTVLRAQLRGGGFAAFDFSDSDLTDRMAKAMLHAVESCGGGNNEPF